MSVSCALYDECKCNRNPQPRLKRRESILHGEGGRAGKSHTNEAIATDSKGLIGDPLGLKVLDAEYWARERESMDD
ncbi:hypothetical protein RUM44_009259 [Polyplax serrata]|uniref:Uncharacterized protein n=1 Tax=Polyplax serrata TaxID=468196 RepID=A0ABR1AS65_POLSC